MKSAEEFLVSILFMNGPDCVNAIKERDLQNKRQGMSDAANIASEFSINQKPIHPDIYVAQMSEQARMVYHTTCQQVCADIQDAANSLK